MQQTSNANSEITEVKDAYTLNMTIRSLITQHELDAAAELCERAFTELGIKDNETTIFHLLFLIRKKELENGGPQTFDLSDDPDFLINHYNKLKFLIRRQEFPQMESLQKELYAYCNEFNVSAISIATITNCCTLHPKEIIDKIVKGFNSYEQS